MTAKKRSVGLGRLLAETARSKKLLLPETEEEIAAAETEVAGLEIDLPQRLRSPLAFMGAEGSFRLGVGPAVAAGDHTTEEGLARAAREGGTITAEIEKRMRFDREDAEAKKKPQK